MKSLEEKFTKVREEDGDTSSDLFNGHSRESFELGKIDYHKEMNESKSKPEEVELDNIEEPKVQSFFSLVACFGCMKIDSGPKIKASELADSELADSELGSHL